MVVRGLGGDNVEEWRQECLDSISGFTRVSKNRSPVNVLIFPRDHTIEPDDLDL